MRGKGICYDTGFFNRGVSTHEPFDPDIVRREMRIIHDDLHCNAVRITGGDIDRLKVTATHAASAGLEVWLCPFTTDLTRDQMLDFLADCADHAEQLRRQGTEVVLATGSELSMSNRGFLPGDTFMERVAILSDPPRLRESLPQVPARIDEFLTKAAAIVRERFGGKITYASLPLEGVDWTRFDYISTDAGYRSRERAGRYRDDIRAFAAKGKPAAITEFGCAPYRGAADNASRSGEIIEWDPVSARPLRLKGDYIRDEEEQATHLRELLGIFEAEGIDSTFVYVFARYDLPHRSNPREDFDLASFGVVKVLEGRHGETYPDMPWEPKAAFAALADYYGD